MASVFAGADDGLGEGDGDGETLGFDGEGVVVGNGEAEGELLIVGVTMGGTLGMGVVDAMGLTKVGVQAIKPISGIKTK